MFKKLLLTATTAGVLATAGSSLVATSAEAHPWHHRHWHHGHHHVFWGCHKVVRWHHHHRVVKRVCY